MSEIIRDISTNDEMFTGDTAHYFLVGASAMECIELALRAGQKDMTDVRRVLDLPCGHGRVLRHIRAAFPDAQITACDLRRDAVDYCAAIFGAIPIYSETHPDRIPLTGPFDLIWCGSLLTHLDETQSMAFLGRFHSLLAENGILVFTLHGPSAAYAVRHGHINYHLDKAGLDRLLQTFMQQGYGYADYPGKGGYGISLCKPSFMVEQIGNVPDFRLLLYLEMGWANHHDVVACVREPLEARVRRALG